MTSLLPAAMLQLVDGNGHPYSGGTLATYIPGTSTPKSTWQDAGQVTLNTNPVVLDASGRCLLYGTGAYRTILKDNLGNTIWDQVTTSTDTLGALLATGLAMTGTLVINTAGMVLGDNYTQSGSGLATNGLFPNFPHAGFAYNYKNVTSDAVMLDTTQVAIGRGIVFGDVIDYHCGGSSINGSRVAHGAFATVTAPIQAANNNYIGASWHFALSASAVPGATPAAPCGNIYAMNPQAQLAPGASNYVSLMGVECDVECDAGASVQYKYGICITTIGADAVRGTIRDAALHIGAIPSTAGWSMGIQFSDFNGGGVPVQIGGTLIGSLGVVGTVSFGVDLRGFTILGRAFTSNGFYVDGSGNMNAKAVGVTALSAVNLVSTGTTQLQGSATNDNAAAGLIGEYVSASVDSGTAVALTSGVGVNITSIALSPGDWDVSGSVGGLPGSGTVTNVIAGGCSTNAVGFNAAGTYAQHYPSGSGAAPIFSAPLIRISIASPTTVYLRVQAGFTTSTLAGYGFIAARRAR